MSSAGTVTVDFAAETAKFTAELKKVRKDMAGLKDSSDRTNAAFASFGNTLRNVASFVAIGAITRSIVKATEESEAAIGQLNNALSNAGANVDAASKDFQGFASQLQNVSTFGDEAIIGVETLLLGFRGLSSGTIKQATTDILDLSTRLGIDLPSAAKTVGKALEDPVKGMTALRKAGVQFTDGQQTLIKSLVEVGDKAGAQQIILKELESRYGGAAEAARNTFAGALAGVKNSLDDLMEVKGGLPAATSSLNQLAKILQDPAVKAGADALFSAIISGAALAAKYIGEIVAGFAIIAGKGQDAVANIDNDINELNLRRDRLIARGFLTPEEDKKFDEQIATLVAKQKALLGLITPAPHGGPNRRFGPIPDSKVVEFTTPGASESDEAAAKSLEVQKFIAGERIKLDKSISDSTQQARDADLLKIGEYGEAALDLRRRNAEEELAIARYRAEQEFIIDRQAQEAIRQQREVTVNAALGLFQALGTKHKAFAALSIAIEKAMAIQRILAANQVAAELAFASQLIPGDPTSIVRAAAAKAAVLAQGRISALLVAATGAIQIAGALSPGGNKLGTPGNPVFTNQAAEDRLFGATSQNVIQIEINGYIGKEQVSQMVDALKEEINEKDVVIIQPNGSAQHSVLNA